MSDGRHTRSPSVCHMNLARLTNESRGGLQEIYASRYGIERDATWFMAQTAGRSW